jgi:hypothetical protein
MKKFLLYFFGTAAVLIGIMYLVAWKSPKYYKVTTSQPQYAIIPFAKYDANHVRPFIISDSQYVIFGASHTKDPENIEIEMIERQWKKLKPTVALVEGRLNFLLPGFMDPVSTLGEGGKLKELAEKDNIEIYNWDLSKEELAQQLTKHFNKEQVALYQILNPYFSNMRFGKPSDPEEYINSFLHRAAYVGLKEQFKSAKDVDAAWKKYFAGGPDWKNVSDETTLPGYLNDIMAVTNDLRNQQLISAVKELTVKGHRVFLLCGSSHAVCVKPSFN